MKTLTILGTVSLLCLSFSVNSQPGEKMSNARAAKKVVMSLPNGSSGVTKKGQINWTKSKGELTLNKGNRTRTSTWSDGKRTSVIKTKTKSGVPGGLAAPAKLF